MKKEKNKMVTFNYKKWLTENRDGKPNINYINEQTSNVTYYGCSICPEGAVIDTGWEGNPQYGNDVRGQPICNPVTSYIISSSNIVNNDSSDWDIQQLYTPNEYIGSDTLPIFLYLDSGSNNIMCSSSGVPVGGGVDPEPEPEPEPTQTYGNTGSTLDGDTCPENAMSIVLTNPGGSFNFNMYCVTVDGQTPQVGDIVIGNNGSQGEILQTAEVGSGEIMGTGGNSIFNLQLVSSGTPEPEGMPEPEGQPVPQGLAAPNTGPQPQGKKKPKAFGAPKSKGQKSKGKNIGKELKETWNRLKKIYKK